MGESTFTVTGPEALYLAADPMIAEITRTLTEDARSRSPYVTGNLAGGYHWVRLGPAFYAVRNDVEYWRFVEFGTFRDRAQPAMGKALAEARARLEVAP